MPLARRPLLISLLAVLAFLVGCQSSPRVNEGPPASFELSITVVNDNAGAQPAWHRPARFVAESDGWLRAGVGPGATRETLPPRIRRLEHKHRLALWEFTLASGVLNPDCPVRVASGDGPVPDLIRPLLLITVRTDDGLYSGAVSLESELARPYHAMVISLTEWAWIGD